MFNLKSLFNSKKNQPAKTETPKTYETQYEFAVLTMSELRKVGNVELAEELGESLSFVAPEAVSYKVYEFVHRNNLRFRDLPSADLFGRTHGLIARG